MSYEYKHPRPAVTTDAVVIAQKEPRKVLLIERGGEPFKGCWAFDHSKILNDNLETLK